MPHTLAAPTTAGETRLQIKLPTALAEQLDVIARRLGRPRTRIAADVVCSFVFEFERQEALAAIATAAEHAAM